MNLDAQNFCWERGFAWTLVGSHGLFVWFSNPVEEVWLARFQAEAATSLQVRFSQVVWFEPNS